MAFSPLPAPGDGEIRRGRGRISHVMLLSAAVTGTLTLAGFAQLNTSGPPKPMISPQTDRPLDANGKMIMREKNVQRRNFDAANAERQRQMAQAAEMLETLAISLKVQIDNDPSGKVSEDQIRKTENIARLAHIVQERMKLTVVPN